MKYDSLFRTMLNILPLGVNAYWFYPRTSAPSAVKILFGPYPGHRLNRRQLQPVPMPGTVQPTRWARIRFRGHHPSFASGRLYNEQTKEEE